MSSSITALVVDDSVLYRKAISRALTDLPMISSVQQASNGKEAIRLFEKEPTDLITLDIEMPLMSGLEAIPELVKIKKDVKILVISSLTKRGASQTIDALGKGAWDFITKEQAFGLMEKDRKSLEGLLLEKVKSISPGFTKTSGRQVPLPNNKRPETKVEEIKPSNPPTKTFNSSIGIRSSNENRTIGQIKKVEEKRPVDILLIGISTGGPGTLKTVLDQRKKNRNYITVIVQHMPPIFTEQLSQNLTKVTGHEVVEASDGLRLRKNMIVIAQGGKQLKLLRSGSNWSCKLTDDPPVNSCKPSVDYTFYSFADAMKNREGVAMILTGMGDDGAKSCQFLAGKGIPVITQTEESCVVYGMPKAVDDLGVVHKHTTPPFALSEAESYMMHPEFVL